MAFQDGPYIQVACFCETILEDKSGVLSLIRIVDTVNMTAAGPNPPEDMPPVPWSGKLVIMLKSGAAHGRSTIRIVPNLPSSETKSPVDLTVHFDGEERGQNLVLDFSFVFELEGLYWFKIYIDDQPVTAIPMRIKYNRLMVAPLSSI